MDDRQFYHLEDYLFDVVARRYVEQGHLSAFDFFCITVWKANRAKSKIAKRPLDRGYPTLDDALYDLTSGLPQQQTPKERLRVLMVDGGFLMPMASAILCVLYPDDFTIYDWRVVEQLPDFRDLTSSRDFDKIWASYQAFVAQVRLMTPDDLSLRDGDRYLWGKSFHDGLLSDIQNKFEQE